MTKDELIEKLADAEHASWARWMEYLFSKCEYTSLGSAIIPSGLVERWKRQIDTSYSELSEQEKQSDRNEVAHILPIIDEYADGKLKNAAVKTISRGGLVNPIGKYPMNTLRLQGDEHAKE